ncbi:hypothetical protein BD311DRAFT_340391 [Dichomitus squalens]|uniref:C2H2-type domain-containing protein n=1 Tax=Dichomitus squalens TaxID=114155 RepID=A0A4Q9N0R3_9APHY|nr:hypothetical protein BD311DRAFT_340391 [Dichomitus squalens]
MFVNIALNGGIAAFTPSNSTTQSPSLAPTSGFDDAKDDELAYKEALEWLDSLPLQTRSIGGVCSDLSFSPQGVATYDTPQYEQYYCGMNIASPCPALSTPESGLGSPAGVASVSLSTPESVYSIPYFAPGEAPCHSSIRSFSPATIPWGPSTAIVTGASSGCDVTRYTHATTRLAVPSRTSPFPAVPAQAQQYGLQLALHQQEPRHHAHAHGSGTLSFSKLRAGAPYESRRRAFPDASKSDHQANGTSDNVKLEGQGSTIQLCSPPRPPITQSVPCPICSKLYNREQDMIRHLKSVHKKVTRYICWGVSMSDAHKYNIHGNARHFECRGVVMIGGCGGTFCRKDVYMRHLKRSRGRCVGDPRAPYHPGNAEETQGQPRTRKQPVKRVRKQHGLRAASA